MKKGKNQNKVKLIKCFLTESDMKKVDKMCADLGVSKSILIRDRLLHPDLIDVDRSELLLILSDIGFAMSGLNAAVDAQQTLYKQQKDQCVRGEKVLDFFNSYQIQQTRLEALMRRLLIRMIRK